MKPATLLVPLFLIPLAGDSTDSLARPDVIPEGMHGVELVLKLDVGPFASCLYRSYVIASGDTFDMIARRECGDVRCSDEIRLLNRALKAEKLEPGTRIVIPPRAIAAESRSTTRASAGAEICWVLFQSNSRKYRRSGPVPILENEPLEYFRGETRVVAVARDRLHWFLGVDGIVLDVTKPPGAVIFSDPIVATRLVPEDDPTTKIDKRVTLKEVKDEKLVFDVNEKRFDKNGKLISESRDQNGTGTPRRGELSLPLAVIGIGALVGVIGLARRRRSASGCRA